MAEIKVENLRPLDDFLLQAARYEVPKSASWGRRVKANLIYYQTNYFVLFAVLFLMMGLIRPTQVLVGMVCTILCAFLVHFISERPGVTEKIRHNHPLLCLVGFGLITYLVVGYFFLTAILLPILVIFLHASMRLRNISNKLANQAEKLGVKKSPMGILLEELGIAFELLDD